MRQMGDDPYHIVDDDVVGEMMLEETRGPTRKNVVETTQVDRKLMLIVTWIETLTSQSSSHRRRHHHAGRCGAACSACP